MPVLSFEISLEKLWDKYRGNGRIGLRCQPVVSVFAVDASFRALAGRAKSWRRRYHLFLH